MFSGCSGRCACKVFHYPNVSYPIYQGSQVCYFETFLFSILSYVAFSEAYLQGGMGAFQGALVVVHEGPEGVPGQVPPDNLQQSSHKPPA